MAKLCAKTNPIIIAVKILGADDGFLPKALILEKLPAAKTAHGPNIHKALSNTERVLVGLDIRPLGRSEGDAQLG